MFGRIAGRYDLMNRLITFGQDRHWREETVRLVQPPAQGRGLDIGMGTGDLSFLLAHQMPQGMVVGIDLTREMLQVAQARSHREDPLGHVFLLQGDALCLPFPDETFDVIVTGFVVRNLVEMRAAFAEMYRVTKRGGRMACLEVSHPEHPIIALLHRLYFTYCIPVLGGVVSGDWEAYRYLATSAAAFPRRDELISIMRAAGWRVDGAQPLMLGAAAIHNGAKEAPSGSPVNYR